MAETWSCRVIEHDFFDAGVRRLVLSKPSLATDFFAGQYLQLVISERRFPFSIANAPGGETLELHIKPTPGSSDSALVEGYLDQRPSSIDITYPEGGCFISKTPDRPLILIAAATGITQMKSICDWVMQQSESQSLSIFWGTLTPEELYLSGYFEALALRHSNVRYYPVISEPHDHWVGRKGLVVDAVIDECEAIEEAEIFISGSPAMVYGTLDRLLTVGVLETRVHADVFDYAPRR
jgi:CDP-4-dehydro-6-deoxyglucose reductase